MVPLNFSAVVAPLAPAVDDELSPVGDRRRRLVNRRSVVDDRDDEDVLGDLTVNDSAVASIDATDVAAMVVFHSSYLDKICLSDTRINKH